MRGPRVGRVFGLRVGGALLAASAVAVPLLVVEASTSGTRGKHEIAGQTSIHPIRRTSSATGRRATSLPVALVSGAAPLPSQALESGALQSVGGASWVFTAQQLDRFTSAGGWTSSDLPPSAGQPLAALAVGPSAAWILTSSGAPGNVTVSVMDTVDGGQSWSSVVLQTNAGATDGWIAFAGSDGFVTITSGTAGPIARSSLYTSTDGGQTWSEAASQVPVGPLEFTGATVGWGLPVSGGPGLMETTDGGATWFQVDVPPLSDLPTALSGETPSPGLPVVASATDLLLPVLYSDGQSVALDVMTSTDDGSRWIPSVPLVDPSLPAAGASLEWTAPTPENWFVATPSSLFATTDGGRSWQESTVALAGAAIADVSFSSPTDGIVLATLQSCGGNQPGCEPRIADRLLMTDDGGSSWVPRDRRTAGSKR